MALLILFVALAFFYSAIIPIFEGPDEDDHFRYAKFIADQRAFPVQEFIAGGGAAGHQGWQPPLYYSLAALVIAPIDSSDYDQQLWRNYAVTFVGDPACCGRNIYYHPDAQNFPWLRTTLAVHLARLLSIFFGALTVAATFYIARTFAAVLNLEFSLAVASLVAFNPSFLFASALVSNDAPLAAFSALVILMWVKLLAGQLTLEIKSAVVLGALIGLAILVKTTAIGLIPFTLLVFALLAFRQHSIHSFVVASFASLGVIIFVDLGWFARNTILYGDPLAYRLMLTSAIFPRSGPLTPAELFQISLPWLWQTFWGGPTPGDFASVILVTLAWLSLVALVGVIIFAIRNSQFAIRSLLATLGAWLAFIIIAQIQFIQTTTGADQGRYLFPAISVIALFIVLGLNEIVRVLDRRRQSEVGSWRLAINVWLIGSFFLLAIFVPFAYTLPAYARPALLSESDVQKIAHPWQATFAGQLQLLGYDLKSRAVKPGETLAIDVYWRALAPMNESYRVFVHLIGQDNRFGGGTDVIPARGAFPTVYWKPGDALRDTVWIPVDANAMPGKYSIEIGLYPVGKPSERLSTESGDDHVLIDGIKIAPREQIVANPLQRVGATLGEQIELVGYDSVIDGQSVHLKLYWRARTSVAIDYKVFVHLVDANNHIVDQADELPQAGNYPTSIWDKDDIIVDAYTLTMPHPGDYRIEIGMYRADSGERLPVSSGGDSIVWKLAQ